MGHSSTLPLELVAPHLILSVWCEDETIFCTCLSESSVPQATQRQAPCWKGGGSDEEFVWGGQVFRGHGFPHLWLPWKSVSHNIMDLCSFLSLLPTCSWQHHMPQEHEDGKLQDPCHFAFRRHPSGARPILLGTEMS